MTHDKPRRYASSLIAHAFLALVHTLLADPLGPSSRRTDLIISEIMYHPASRPEPDSLEFIELYNAGLISIPLSGYRLSGEWDYTFPDNTEIHPGDFLVVASHPEALKEAYPINNILGGFSQRLSNGVGRIRLRHPNGAILLEVNYDDAPPWPSQADGHGPSLILNHPSFGEDDPRAWAPSIQHGGTPGTAPLPTPKPSRETEPILSKSLQTTWPFLDLVVSELMYHPISGDSDDEYIEIYNRSDQRIDLGGWKIADGIQFEFQPGSYIDPKHYLVIAKNREKLFLTYPHLTPEQVLGNYDGKLSNRGETLRFKKPAAIRNSKSNSMEGILTYHDGGLWSSLADGDGSSLELVDLKSDPRLGANWEASDETTKSEWTLIEHSGVAARGNGTANALEVILLGSGECLLDELELLPDSGENQIVNPSFETDSRIWKALGTHSQTKLHIGEGSSGERSLHLKAVARGNTGPNKIEFPLRRSIRPGSRITLRARGRWLSGDPDLILRLKGNYLEAAGSLALPQFLGTPGLPNSRSRTNVGPAIHSVIHAPVLPAPNAPVRVTAQVSDPDGISRVDLRYHLDGSSDFISLPMNDLGLAGDLHEDDGIYSTQIPGQPEGTLVAFALVSTDGASPAASSSFPGASSSQECYIRFGEIQPSTTIPTYRMWMTDATLNAWRNGHNLDNSPHPVTFVYNDERIIYGAQALYAGSPHIAPSFNSPAGRPCGYNLILPGDQRFLGVKELALDWPGRDPTALQEPTAYWIAEQAGLPFSHRRFIHLHVNGVTSNARGTVFEDAQQINGDYVSSWSPGDSQGDLYKAEQWFEFPSDQNKVVAGHPQLLDFRTPGGDRDLAHYRWLWLKRAVTTSAHDYTRLFELVDAANTTNDQDFIHAMGRLIDIEEWMGVMAIEQIVVNFDAYGSDIGKNMYAYKPKSGPWQLYMWDIDWVMLASASHGFNPRSPLMYEDPARFGEFRRDPIIARMYETPSFQRAYFRTVKAVTEGPITTQAVSERLSMLHRALLANRVTHSAGVALEEPQPLIDWLEERRRYLESRLAELEVSFEITAPAPHTVLTGPSIKLRGTAPIEVHQIEVGGIRSQPSWASVSEWTLEIPILQATSDLSIQGISLKNKTVASTTLPIRIAGNTAQMKPQIVINEWMASNTRFRDPADNQTDDWFELFNPGNEVIRLSGWYLTDDPNQPTKFIIPSDIQLDPKAFLLVWADAQPDQNGQGADLHTSFKLDRNGEIIQLRDPSGRLVDTISYGPQVPDTSEGRSPDAAERINLQTFPSPGSVNTAPSENPLQLEVAFDPETSALLINWNSKPGRLYQLQTSDLISAHQWTTIHQITATQQTTSHSIPISPVPERYFRILTITDDFPSN